MPMEFLLVINQLLINIFYFLYFLACQGEFVLFHWFRSLESLPERAGVLSLRLTLLSFRFATVDAMPKSYLSRGNGYPIPLGFLVSKGWSLKVYLFAAWVNLAIFPSFRRGSLCLA